MSVSSVQSGSSGVYTTALTEDESLKDQFLSLLVAQIQNQDPFNPMDNQQFVSQLTELTSLEQLQSINTQLTDNQTVSQSLNNTMLLSLVGRRATVAGDGLTVSGGDITPLKLQAASGGSATVTVTNSSGRVVATYTREVSQGWNDLPWDGRLADGSLAPDGEYTFAVAVNDRAGAEVESVAYVTGTVDSIRFENNIAIVSIGGQDYYVSEIAQVSK